MELTSPVGWISKQALTVKAARHNIGHVHGTVFRQDMVHCYSGVLEDSSKA